jgi:type I site-specific restriction endonuclease
LQPDEIAKQIRTNLLAQRNRLSHYLDILEAQEKDINTEDADKLMGHIDIESEIINELQQFKKLLVPLEEIYYKLPYKKDDTLFHLKESIEKLSGDVKVKSNDNKLKLETLIQKVQLNLRNFNKTKINHSPYAVAQPGMVDISG